MKKFLVVFLSVCLLVTLFGLTPAMANDFWPGVAVGVGSAILLGALISQPAVSYQPAPPVRVHYYYPPPPVYYDRHVHGHRHYVPRGYYGHYPDPRHWRGRY